MLTQILSSYRDFHYKFLVFVSDNGPSEEEQYIDCLLYTSLEKSGCINPDFRDRIFQLLSEKIVSYFSDKSRPVS